jgi:DNA-binding MarR family transcriptional regulator
VGNEQALLSGVALGVFRLNGQFLGVAEELARPAGLTAARWQVLGAVLDAPLTVAGIARVMGITRQSVQRIADLLVADRLAEYAPNPAHRRSKLLRPTEQGYAAVQRIDPYHALLAEQLAAELGHDEFRRILEAVTRLSAALDAVTERRRSAAVAPGQQRRRHAT